MTDVALRGGATAPGIYLASTTDFATGEGLTIHFMAAYALNEAEFRRMFGDEIGHGFAEVATIGFGADARVPFVALFMSDVLQRKLKAIEQGERDSGMLRYVARHHTNYS